ncbi:hypothetical protein J2W22_003033 [Sphingomonas kyeonggiensis]|uniref:phage tail protein n=1 Tax=Sphingomonas kyeonggiensis TaxID=1268553 RepID=UPI0027891B7D|nr:phage tail protein [Sphingomonas kyeonggiensis]MDQ0250969.1 hypothetical protein [Sphingomonas kyeonggiensis]
MNKLDACRAAIVAANSELAQNPDRLMIWADKGRVVTRLTTALGYEWRYRANILLEGLTSSPDAIMVPVLLWLREAQADLLLNFQRGDEAVKFEAHILDANSWDLKVEFELSEAVTLTPRDGGGWDVTHLPEPPIGDMLLEGAGATPLREIWLGGEQLIPRP